MRASPMTYLLLSNRTKDGYVMSDLFKRADNTLKNVVEFREDMTFVQMARLVQVLLISNIVVYND